MRRNLQSRQGGAMVELVVLMLVFIPLIMLPMYFQDAFRYKLDYQEAVSSTAWDFAFQNYEDNEIDKVNGAVESYNQKLYANLWSGNERAKKDPAGPWADFNWDTAVKCEGDKDFGKCYMLVSNSFHGEYTKGGLATCKGTISVSNHYVPRVFLQEFASKNLFDPGKNALVYPEYKFGVLVDPWAVTGCEDNGKCPRKKNETEKYDVQKDGQGDDPAKEFYERVEYVWKKGISIATYTAFWASWWDFCITMWNKEIANWGVGIFLLDNPTKLKLTSMHTDGRSNRSTEDWFDQKVNAKGGQRDFNVTPFRDGKNNKYKKTWDNRKSYYLGCKNFGPNCS